MPIGKENPCDRKILKQFIVTNAGSPNRIAENVNELLMWHIFYPDNLAVRQIMELVFANHPLKECMKKGDIDEYLQFYHGQDLSSGDSHHINQW
jgi:hypothetical protein